MFRPTRCKRFSPPSPPCLLASSWTSSARSGPGRIPNSSSTWIPSRSSRAAPRGGHDRVCPIGLAAFRSRSHGDRLGQYHFLLVRRLDNWLDRGRSPQVVGSKLQRFIYNNNQPEVFIMFKRSKVFSLVLALALVVLALPAYATSLVDVSAVAVDTTMVGTVGGVVVTALASLWGLRKLIKFINRS